MNNLSASKQAILRKRLEAARSAVTTHKELSRTIPVAPDTDALPLSFMQEQLWFLDQLVPGCPAYNVFEAVRIKGQALSIPALERSFAAVVRRHQILRSTFRAFGSKAVQVVSPPEPFRLVVDDLRHIEPSERKGETLRLARAEAQRPFDLSRDLMLRARLLRIADDEYLLLVNVHHIAADGWSLGVLYRELSSIYRAEAEGRDPGLAELPIQFSDYAAWQRSILKDDKLQSQLAWWKTKLAGAPDVVEFPRDHPRPTQPAFRGALEWFTIPADVVERLKALARQESATLFMVVAAAFKTLLHRYTGLTDIVVGSTVAGREFWETESVIGPFINALPLRTDLSGNPTFRALLGRLQNTLLDAYAHQDVPLELLVKELPLKRSVPHLPLFQTMLIMQSVPSHGFEVPGFTSERTEVDNGTAKFDLTLSMTDGPQGLVVACEYSRELFEADTIRRWIGHFQTLLRGIAVSPDLPLSELPLMTRDEQDTVLVEWNETESPYPHTKTVVDLFEEQVARTPGRRALRCGGIELSYKQLDERATELANFLAGRGIGPETLVGVCMKRSADLVIAVLSVLKAGGAYVPMDPEYPSERLQYIAHDSRLSLVLTDATTDAVVLSVPTLCVTRPAGRSCEITPQRKRAGPENLAYVIYTSGSTGQPKGVAVEHRSVNAFLHWVRGQFSDEELQGVLFSTSISFDLSVFELFAPLSWGGKVIVVTNGIEWVSSPEAAEVTLVNTVPSVAKEWLRTGSLPAGVRTINLAGEPLPQAIVDQLYSRFSNVQAVYDLYGPTEDTVYSTYALRNANGIATIGRPLANKQIYLLDASRKPVPIGMPGELYIGGSGLARGYLHRPDLTAERFVPSPFVASGRLYRTGDLARYRANGQIEYLGRADHQVKIRGFRIELGEIEAKLSKHPEISEATVVPVDDPAAGKLLVAYLVLKRRDSIDAGELRQFLKRSLPEYMIPSAFICVEAFPLTPNGKIDRKALALHFTPGTAGASQPSTASRGLAPRTPTEEKLSAMWRDVLNLPAVMVDQDFFTLGGHSILALQVIARVREAFGCDLPVRRLFDSPTIAELAKVIEEKLLEEILELSDEEAEQLSSDNLVRSTP